MDIAMVGISFAELIFALLALLGLGGTAIVVTVIAIAAAKKRSGLALVLAGLTFLGLLVVAGGLLTVIGFRSSPHVNSEVYYDGSAGFPMPDPIAINMSSPEDIT